LLPSCVNGAFFSEISARLKEIQLLFKLLSNPINHAVAPFRLPLRQPGIAKNVVLAIILSPEVRDSSMISQRFGIKSFFVLFVLFELFSATVALSQGTKGTIAGRAVDSGGGVLQGARIVLEPGEISLVSDAQGEFTIAGVNPQTYTITVSFDGLEA